jgi:hypothetical protein
MTKATKGLSRRHFLLAAGIGTAAVATKHASVKTEAPPAGKRATRGYHASGHIDNYYRTTKI